MSADSRVIECLEFQALDLNDSFFNSLKNDYPEFPSWFSRKATEKAWVSFNGKNDIVAFLYLKVEEGPLEDVEPPRPHRKRLKIGTFKVEPKTNLGNRFVTLLLEEASRLKVDEVYVTVLEKHSTLIRFLLRWGFLKKGKKLSSCGVELVLIREASLGV